MIKYKPVSNEKISGRIAKQIKENILNGLLRPDDRLPPVRELVVQFEASAASVREALKMLESFGLVSIKSGSGVYIAELGSSPMDECLSSVLRIQKTSLHEITEARLILEPGVAQLAASNCTPEDLEKLESIIQQIVDLNKANMPTDAKYIEFHSTVVESTHNVVLVLITQTVLNAMRKTSWEIRDFEPGTPDKKRKVLAIHRKILKAIREGRSREAYELMLKDVQGIEDILLPESLSTGKTSTLFNENVPAQTKSNTGPTIKTKSKDGRTKITE